MGEGLRSPKGHVLRQLEGNPGDIDGQARDLVSAAQVMQKTANALTRISDGTNTVAKAESMDKVRESAGDVAPQLKKAATRYQMTGDALIVYANELQRAQNEIRSRTEDIGDKHRAVQTARSAAAQEGYPDLQGPDCSGGQEWSPGLQTGSSSSLAVSTAENELKTAWDGFDRVFGDWEDAYDKAIDKIDDAFDEAGNNDAWGEDFLAALGYAGAILCVVALFCTGPVALVIGAIGLAVAAAVLAITVMKRTKGRGSNADLAWAVAGMLPFVRPLKTAKGAVATLRGAKTTMTGGKATLRSSLQSTVRVSTRSGSRPGVPKTKTRPPRQIEKIANKKAEKLLNEFDQSNSLWNRIGMNVVGGGHSDVKALGNFIRANPGRTGAGAVEWAASNAPEISTFAKFGYGVETSGAFLVAGDFFANEHVVAYSEWRN